MRAVAVRRSRRIALLLPLRTLLLDTPQPLLLGRLLGALRVGLVLFALLFRDETRLAPVSHTHTQTVPDTHLGRRGLLLLEQLRSRRWRHARQCCSRRAQAGKVGHVTCILVWRSRSFFVPSAT